MKIKVRGNKASARAFTIVALKGIIMEREYTQSMVGRAYAFVEDMFGLPHGDKTPYREASPVVRMTPEEAGLTCDDAMGLEPEAHTMKTVAEVSAESARRDDSE
jgi:hypothetical protein